MAIYLAGSALLPRCHAMTPFQTGGRGVGAAGFIQQCGRRYAER
jgi:hypothetical protein